MSSLIKSETGSGLHVRTNMKETKTEFTWTIQNVQDFKVSRQTAVSPKFYIGELRKHGAFHLELSFPYKLCGKYYQSGKCYKFELVKEQLGSLKIKLKVHHEPALDSWSEMNPEKILEISSEEKLSLCFPDYNGQKELVIKVELAVFEPVSE